MNGLTLSRRYYEAFGRPMIHEKFPEYESRIAVGLVGEGSECFGFDDEYSRDHDFGPAFCMWLDEETMAAIGTRLQNAYEQLPEYFEGMKVRRDSVMTGHRTGVWEIGAFYHHFLGTPGAPQDLLRWLRLPESYFAVAVNGQVFRDDAGTFCAVREILQKGYPEDVRIKKMAARGAVMSQAGQYNYPRCLKRGERVAAALALSEFMQAGMSMVYLLNHRYAPFYKWMHRGLKELDLLSETAGMFETMADPETSAAEKQDAVETVCGLVAGEWKRQGLTRGGDPFLQVHLDELMGHIKDEGLRRMHWLDG